jgi:hypothetical protein
VSITTINWWMLKEMGAVYCDKYPASKMQSYWQLKQMVHRVTTTPLRVNHHIWAINSCFLKSWLSLCQSTYYPFFMNQAHIHAYLLKIHFNIITPSTPSVPSRLFTADFVTKILYAFLVAFDVQLSCTSRNLITFTCKHYPHHPDCS